MDQIKLRAEYKAKLPQLRSELALSVQSWQDNESQDNFEKFFIKVLDISGSAKMFGYDGIGSVANSLQNEMSELYQQKRTPNNDEEKRIISVSEQLLGLLSNPTEDNNTEIREIAFKPKVIDREPMHVLILEDDPTKAQDLANKIGSGGYQVTVAATIAEIHAKCKTNTCALVANLDNMSEKQRTLLADVEEVKAFLPLIYISADLSINARLSAVKGGGQAFVSTPIDYARLLQSIDSLTGRLQQQNFRVLIVDDQKSLSDYYSSILKAAEFDVCCVNNPETELMAALNDFTPDLILLDLYMPYCNGQDLAGIIRQMDNYISVPVVFLSAEASSDLQLRAMSTGADAFLTKPVSPDDLLLTVQSRIKRGRAVHDLVTKDALSGLLNRRESLRCLDVELARGKRQGTPVSVAILDLDHFKKINDNHGHSVGDWVIKFFARSMQKVFRETDIIGRQGGEEFIVIFPDTETEDAHKACKRLSKYIKENGTELPVQFTYSGGIALVSEGEDSKSVLDRSDMALYKAKDMGRNKVITATDNPLA